MSCTEGNELINKVGAKEEICSANNIIVDEDNKLVTTPAFMLNAPLIQIHKGISNLVSKIIEMCAMDNTSL